MTLNTTYKPAVAQGNGIIKEFSYSFNPLSLSYIKVYFEVDGKWVEQKTGWSATVSDSGGVVTFLTAPTTRVSIERDIPESQPTSYTTSSGFQAKVIENSFDLLTGMVQELKDASDRSVKVEVGDNQTPEELLEEVYNKLDSATAIAGDAINAANQAQTAADNATAAVNQAEQTLTEVTNYVDLAKSDIEDTKNTAISTIDNTVSNAKGEIANTIVSAKTDINASIDEATMNISDIVSDAEGSITNIAVTEANKAIANAAQEATDTATANLNSYVDGTVKPSLQTYIDQAQADANSAATSMEQAALSATAASNYASNASASETNALSSKNAAASSATAASGFANNAKIWAEGTDSEVQGLGGVHSSKVWSETAQSVVSGKQDIANLSQTLDDSTTKYPSNAAVKAAIDAKDRQLNNPFFFGMHIWSDTAISNASWLISNGSYHSGATYASFYEWLLKIYNGTLTVDGVSVKAYGASGITDYDYVINTADTTFRLPIKVKLASGNAVAGNGMNLGLTKGNTNFNLQVNSNGVTSITVGQYGNPVGSPYSDIAGANSSLGVTKDPTKSGIETSSQGLKLYFYVGETVQDANVINAAGVLTRVANCIDRTVASDRETVVGWGMPDYSAMVSKSKNVEYTAEVSGWVKLYLRNGTTDPFSFIIDGEGVFYNPREGNHYNTYPPIFIGKGQKYKLIGGGTVGQFVFIPCKGVN